VVSGGVGQVLGGVGWAISSIGVDGLMGGSGHPGDNLVVLGGMVLGGVGWVAVSRRMVPGGVEYTPARPWFEWV